jgi:hypothetical protein
MCKYLAISRQGIETDHAIGEWFTVGNQVLSLEINLGIGLTLRKTVHGK